MEQQLGKGPFFSNSCFESMFGGNHVGETRHTKRLPNPGKSCHPVYLTKNMQVCMGKKP